MAGAKSSSKGALKCELGELGTIVRASGWRTPSLSRASLVEPSFNLLSTAIKLPMDVPIATNVLGTLGAV